MIEGIPRISITIICYKQEELIKRAINSLLAQKDYIYEICVSDDCSPDCTWEVLQDYSAKYPGLFILNRNEPNTGIFENVEKTWEMPTGDIVYSMAGDDEAGEGWFKKVIDYIQKNNIDYKNELFCIYGDFSIIYPNGDKLLFQSNSSVLKDIHPLNLALRGELCNRSTCYSKKILDKFIKCSKGRSYIAENAQDRQLQVIAQKNYYIPAEGNKYYAHIGVSTGMRSNNTILKDRELDRIYTREVLEKLGYEFSKKDLYILKRDTEKRKVYRKGKLIQYPKILYYSILGFNWRASFNLHFVKIAVFAILRRLPHKSPITLKV